MLQNNIDEFSHIHFTQVIISLNKSQIITNLQLMNQMNSPIFKTQAKIPKQLLNRTQRLTNYVDGIDKQIYKVFHYQNTVLSIKKRQIESNLDYIEQKHKRSVLKFNEVEDYFVKYCESILRRDIDKWKSNSIFFKKLFKVYDSEIEQRKQQNEKLQKKIKALKDQVKNIIKTNLYNDINLKIKNINSHQKDKKTATKQLQKQQLTSQKGLQNTTQNIKTKEPYETNRVKKVYSMPKIQNLTMNQHNYMNPIKSIKLIQQTKLGQLSVMLEWYIKNTSSKGHWFQKILFYERNYHKLQQYLKKNSTFQVKRVVTEV